MLSDAGNEREKKNYNRTMQKNGEIRLTHT